MAVLLDIQNAFKRYGEQVLLDGANATITDDNVVLMTLPPAEIKEYIASGSPMDKAGAYGIQDDYGAVFVTRIEGCFYNVVGLPLASLYGRLTEMSRTEDGRS